MKKSTTVWNIFKNFVVKKKRVKIFTYLQTEVKTKQNLIPGKRFVKFPSTKIIN